jgi:hypothetical protein
MQVLKNRVSYLIRAAISGFYKQGKSHPRQNSTAPTILEFSLCLLLPSSSLIFGNLSVEVLLSIVLIALHIVSRRCMNTSCMYITHSLHCIQVFVDNEDFAKELE